MSDMWTELFKKGMANSRKTEEEKAKEAQELEKKRLETEEKIREIKKKTEGDIKRQKNKPSVKLALKILNKSNKKDREKTSPNVGNATDYLSRANELGKTLYQEKASRHNTFLELTVIESSLDSLAETIEWKMDSFPEENEPSEYKTTRSLRKTLKNSRLPPIGGETDYPEVKHIKNFVKQVSRVKDHYYNTHLFIENGRFISDEDPKATPLNFYSIKRITEFIRTIAGDPARLRYLRQMERCFLDDDPRGFIYKDGNRNIGADKKFQRRLRDLIDGFEQTSIKYQNYGEFQPLRDDGFKKSSVSETTENEDKTGNAKNIAPRGQKEVFYLLEAVLNTLNCASSNTEKGNLMSFLSGYSSATMRQSFSNSEECSTSKKKWTDSEKIESLEIAHKFAKAGKLHSSVVKNLEKQLDELRSKKY